MLEAFGARALFDRFKLTETDGLDIVGFKRLLSSIFYDSKTLYVEGAHIGKGQNAVAAAKADLEEQFSAKYGYVRTVGSEQWDPNAHCRRPDKSHPGMLVLAATT